jgi:molybdate transport system ATP-binding protein
VDGGLVSLHARVRTTMGPSDLDVELDVPAGTTAAVVGPNGAGKTTLLRVLAGLHPLEDGDVVLDGRSLADVAPEDRPVGYVFQDHLLFPHLSLAENVAFGLRSRGVERRAALRTAGGWLERVGLGGRDGERPRALSGGEAQRVALARALAPAPRLLLLDEPMAALDATTRQAMRRDLATFLRDHDGVRVLVTHDAVEAMALADRVHVLEGGRVVQAGTPAELTARPRSAFVADLVGLNLFAADVVARGVAEVTGPPAVRFAWAGADVDGAVFVVVHPRAVALHRHAPEGSARNVWAGEAVSVDAEGDRARVRIALGGAVLVAEVTAAAVRDLDLVAGGRVWASTKATEVAVYPR